MARWLYLWRVPLDFSNNESFRSTTWYSCVIIITSLKLQNSRKWINNKMMSLWKLIRKYVTCDSKRRNKSRSIATFRFYHFDLNMQLICGFVLRVSCKSVCCVTLRSRIHLSNGNIRQRSPGRDPAKAFEQGGIFIVPQHFGCILSTSMSNKGY